MQRVGKIFWCQPGDKPKSLSARAFWKARYESSYAPKMIEAQGDASILTYTMNTFLTLALNAQLDGEDITHWGMLHSDVVPDDGFFDIIMEDLLEHDADFMGAIIPIKDRTAITSTGYLEKGEMWEVDRRLVLRDLEKFGMRKQILMASDIGPGVLLANTGCCMMRFDQEWRKELLFTVQDRIIMKDGRYVPQVIPEDWNLCKRLHEMGCKVMVSRQVALSHYGDNDWSNRSAWGVEKDPLALDGKALEVPNG